MESPNTPAGRITELIMARIIENRPLDKPLKIWESNRIYEAIFTVLHAEFELIEILSGKTFL